MKVNGCTMILLVGALLSGGDGFAQRPRPLAADLVVRNATILTIDPENPRAEAVAVVGEKIVAVTSNRGVEPYIDSARTRVVDGARRLLIPGFNDAHIHLVGGGKSLMNLDFRNVRQRETIREMVRRRVAEVGPGVLVRGRGWEHELFPDKKWPTKDLLDDVSPDNPVILARVDGHSILVNQFVLAASGITGETPDPAGGTIVRDPETGQPTGILKETATDLVELSDFETADPELRRRADRLALEKALERARRVGVTSLQHLNGNEDVLQEIRDAGQLTARITFNLWLTDDPETLRSYETLRRRYPPEGNWLRFGYLKGFIDGTLGSGTALMFEPFDDAPETSGLAMMEYDELQRRVLAADRRGFQIGIHAIGTRGNHWILNAFEAAARENRPRDARHRSEHAQLLADADIPRFTELGVIASMQPTHCITDKRFAEKRIGWERCRGAYAWRRLLDSGAAIAFGTDWPVEPMNPMEGLYAAITRKDREGEPGPGWFPDQRLSMEEAIQLYTQGSAYAEFMEDRKGMLKTGYLADMVLLDRNLLTIPAEEIMHTQVDLTVVGGRIVFERNPIEKETASDRDTQ